MATLSKRLSGGQSISIGKGYWLSVKRGCIRDSGESFYRRGNVQYVKHFIDLSRKAGDRGYCYLLFVFCHYDASRCSSLLHRVHRVAQAAKNYPKHLNIIPMCFQEDRVIAILYSRSDATITRSGGLTSMELMSVARGKIWIHSGG